MFDDGSRAAGIHESFQEQNKTKLCFTGDYNTICSNVKTSVAQLNQALANEGAETKLHVKACAQTVKLAMVMYTFKSVESGSNINKTIYVKECK